MIRAVRYAGWGALFVLASWALCDFLGRLWMRSGLWYRPGQSAAALGGAVLALLAIAFVALMLVGVIGVALSGASRDHNFGHARRKPHSDAVPGSPEDLRRRMADTYRGPAVRPIVHEPGFGSPARW